MNKVKIIIGYHKPAALIKSDIYVPIHLGRALSKKMHASRKEKSSEEYKWMVDNMIGDDTGDNISIDNRRYGELTGIYWAWKNYDKLDNPEYIGFMHYRRIFSFHPSEQDKGGLNIPRINEDVVNYHLNQDEVLSSLNGTDMVIPKPMKMLHGKLMPDMHIELTTPRKEITNWEAYANLHNARDLDMSIDYIKGHYPACATVATDYFKKKEGYYKNLFIFKKEIFLEYCKYMFETLAYVDNHIDYSTYSAYNQRTVGFLSERLTGLFIEAKIKENKTSKQIPMAFVRDVSLPPSMQPAYACDNVPIFCSTDDNYAPYCGVLLQSIIEHSNEKHNYDFIVLESNLSENNKRKIQNLCRNHANISIRFCNVSGLIQNESKFHLCAHFTIETYYRLFSPSIFANYEKLIYLDIDTIVRDDIAKLFNIDMGDNWVAAALDIGVMGKIHSKRYESVEYFQKEVGVKDPFNEYFSAAVMLFNIQELKKYGVQEKLLTTALSNKFFYVDQDVLNKVCYGHVYFFDSIWNVTTKEGRKKETIHLAPAIHFNKWLQDRNLPSIIHYSSYIKPWAHPNSDLAYYWWESARNTIFYEEIVFKNILTFITEKGLAIEKNVNCKNESLIKALNSRNSLMQITNNTTIKEFSLYRQYRWRYIRYKLLSKITFGSARKHYKHKREIMKLKLREIRRFMRNEINHISPMCMKLLEIEHLL